MSPSANSPTCSMPMASGGTTSRHVRARGRRSGQHRRGVHPDFYLCDFDTYVELTTLRQPLVTKKNRKVRRLLETHPDVAIKLLYRKDIERLEAKYRLADAA